MSQSAVPDPYQLIDLSPDDPVRLLAFNSGSLSVRYDYIDTERPERRLSGIVEGVGSHAARHRVSGPDVDVDQTVSAPDHRSAVDLALDQLRDLGLHGGDESLSAVGHRVLYSADGRGSAAVVDDELMQSLMKAGFEPWRQSQRLMALAHCRERLPEVPQVAVFDNAFFRTMPEVAQVYGIPYSYYKQFGLRRYGFQGLSHKYAGMRSAMFLDRPFGGLKLITAHLGAGASLCAVDHGRAKDTTMGLTPLAGLVMGRRCGDLDPGLVLHLLKIEGWSPERLARMLDRESGLLGLSGISHDMRSLLDEAEKGDPRALLAIQVFCHRVRGHAGAMVASLDGLDALVFTGGVGENSAGIRARICQGLGHLGVELDDERNRAGLGRGEEVAAIEHPGSRVRVLLVRSDEARMIARETVRALGRTGLNSELRKAAERLIPIGVSAHHVHLTQEHVEALFGPGRTLTPKAPLTQPGQFASEERVTLIGPRGRVERVRVLGPARRATQVEISRTEEFHLGIDAPVRNSGDLEGTPGLTLQGTAGTVELPQGVICARRHVHMTPQDAAHFGAEDRDVVMVEVGGERQLIFGDVLVRVKDSYALEMHVDTDEANAGELSSGMTGRLLGIQSRPG